MIKLQECIARRPGYFKKVQVHMTREIFVLSNYQIMKNVL